MKRVLFVDDDAAVLDALRARLRPMQHKWDMTFAENGGQAIAAFQREPYDLIVSDIRMPGAHGARLLRTVSERWPGTVRIALTGVSDSQEILQLVPVVHQFLSKPCEAPRLENLIERCLALHALLPEPRLRILVGRVRRLAPRRTTCTKLQSLLLDPQVLPCKVAQLISSDVATAAKIMHVASSEFFRSERTPCSIEEAVAYLGVETVRRVISSTEVFSQWRNKPVATCVNLEYLHGHAQTVARVAQALCTETELVHEAGLAGLLHDIGYWVLAQESPRELDRAQAYALEKTVSMEEAEREIIGASHAQIGAYLLGIWGLKPAVIAAVAYHHSPQRVRQTRWDTLAAVATAHALADSSDAAAFKDNVSADARIAADYFEALSAPFSWDEAVRRASDCVATNDESG